MVIKTKITEMLGIKHPIIAAPMDPFYTKELTYDGDIDEGAVLLGQSIGVIDSIDTVPEIINEIVRDAGKRLREANSCII